MTWFDTPSADGIKANTELPILVKLMFFPSGNLTQNMGYPTFGGSAMWLLIVLKQVN
jgi:hypothetical protein